MVETKINFKELIPKFDAILSRGLCKGVGTADGQMCIEAAICQSMGLPFGDDPECVASSVRTYKITINDKKWSSPQARAAALRDIGIAQIGSKGVVDDLEFTKRLATKTIQVLIPTLFEEIFPSNQKCLKAARLCREKPTKENVLKAKYTAAVADAAAVAYAAYAAAAAADAAAAAADAAAIYAAAYAIYAAAYAAYAAGKSDKYLILSVNLALEVLKELKSPGCEWI